MIGLITLISGLLIHSGGAIMPVSKPLPEPALLISSHKMSLEDRWDNPAVNEVMRDNILLNLAYMKGTVVTKDQINWDNIRLASDYSFVLKPQETFAFDDSILPNYLGKITKTGNSHFTYAEGFKSDGYLAGDGVCHLASLINWSARDAHLDVVAPTNHDFAKINDIPKEYGVAIFATNSSQNLYITNNQNRPVEFKFHYDGKYLEVSVWQLQS